MDIKLVRLYDVYAPLLSERQREIMTLYYNEDESLAEIAENTGITRQGVRDHIKKCEGQLLGFEEALGLCKRLDALRACASRAQNALEEDDGKALFAALEELSELL